jgi:integrase/recombinase XerD
MVETIATSLVSAVPATGLSTAAAFDSAATLALRKNVAEARDAWLTKTPSKDTRTNYAHDLGEFLAFAGSAADRPELLAAIRPQQVAAWRDHLMQLGRANSSIRRKMTVLRSLFSYLQTYGYVGTNPAHSDFVAAPQVPRDGKTLALSPDNCRRLLDAPITELKVPDSDETIPVLAGIRDRALLAILAYTGCRVGELVRLKVGSYKLNGVHRVLEIHGKGGKERLVPLHLEAVERIEAWLEASQTRTDASGPLLRPRMKADKDGKRRFARRPMSCRAVQKLVEGYVARLKLDPNVTVHSLRVTALTTAREAGSDIIDLQDFAGHADPRTTLTYIRSRDRLSKSPAYVLRY